MMPGMDTHKTQGYNTNFDEEIISLGGVPDGNGGYLDIHETLFHSKSEGFYIQRRIRQSKRGRTWETLQLGDYELPGRAASIRYLTVHRRMTRLEVMQFVIKAYMPVTEGLQSEALLALERAASSIANLVSGTALPERVQHDGET